MIYGTQFSQDHNVHINIDSILSANRGTQMVVSSNPSNVFLQDKSLECNNSKLQIG